MRRKGKVARRTFIKGECDKMATSGTKPMPVQLKLLRGNPGKKKLAKTEWRPPLKGLKAPEPPDYLGDLAKEEWRRVAPELTTLGCLHPVADISTLAAYCQAFERWQVTEKEIGDLGSALRAAGNITAFRIIAVANKAMKDMVHYAGDLGMTPVARARIGNAVERNGDSTLESLLAK
jgi:P27 family predicted phage terminase small subunit